MHRCTHARTRRLIASLARLGLAPHEIADLTFLSRARVRRVIRGVRAAPLPDRASPDAPPAKAGRLKVPRATGAAPAARRRRAAEPPLPAIVPAAHHPSAPRRTVGEDPPPPPTGPVAFTDLTFRSCRWPVAACGGVLAFDAPAEWYCGKPRTGGAYCPGHARVAFAAPRKAARS